MNFENLGLVEPILRAVRHEGYQTATPIQVQAIPQVINGRDLIGCAQTGTGKTAAFALPTLQRLLANGDASKETQSGESQSDEPQGKKGRRRSGSRRAIRALVLSPTRELAAQTGESFAAYGRFTHLRHAVVFGGVSQGAQVRALQKGVDTLVATPGRLLDLMDQGHVDLSGIEIFILDEADRMLDMGFIHDLRRIAARVPRNRQTLMFSATMPEEIRRLAAQWLTDPLRVQVAGESEPVEKISQSVYMVEPRQKPQLLARFLQKSSSTRTLVFSRTKHGADKIVRGLLREGIRAAAIHGNKSQAARKRVLDSFKSDMLPVLIATDIAARGLDVDDISHVINYDMPQDAETYVHRIGRTGRAGAAGIAVSFCGRDEQSQLRLIERLIRRSIAVEPQQADDAPAETPSYGKTQTAAQPVQPAKPSKPFAPRGKSRRPHGRSAKPKTARSQEGVRKPAFPKAKGKTAGRRYRKAV